ncbi:hypothetical protein J6590_104175 [Homalodisca vitripennis]|nr:hypothetical protein J6590_104175 [Homalodisca vitripennis]
MKVCHTVEPFNIFSYFEDSPNSSSVTVAGSKLQLPFIKSPLKYAFDSPSTLHLAVTVLLTSTDSKRSDNVSWHKYECRQTLRGYDTTLKLGIVPNTLKDKQCDCFISSAGVCKFALALVRCRPQLCGVLTQPLSLF